MDDSLNEYALEASDVVISKAPEKPTPSQTINQKVVKTGSISFESKEIKKDYLAISELLKKFDAYIENESESKNDYRINYSMSIRVNPNQYDSLFNSLVSLSPRLDEKSSQVEDVTERYYDLKTRIKNKKALEERYVALLEKANEIKDILEIERNINEVRTDVEKLEGQFNYLKKLVSLSKINVTFYEVLPYAYESSAREGFGARMLGALDSGWQGFLFFLVGLASLWPFVLLLAVGILFLRRIKLKEDKKRKLKL